MARCSAAFERRGVERLKVRVSFLLPKALRGVLVICSLIPPQLFIAMGSALRVRDCRGSKVLEPLEALES